MIHQFCLRDTTFAINIVKYGGIVEQMFAFSKAPDMEGKHREVEHEGEIELLEKEKHGKS